jgi:D-apionolactonase
VHRNVLYYGREESLPESHKLWAGPLSLIFEEGGLRYLRVGHREVVRGIYAAVRDRNWETVAPRFSALTIQTSTDCFDISFEAEHIENEIDFWWKGQIAGQSNGTIVFTFDGLARSTFLRNRIGFCVLHPAQECAGAPCLIERADGSRVPSQFPKPISSQQPVPGLEDMLAISYPVTPGLDVRLAFTGDLFETEDQRNWTDASFKTFCTPLRLPRPVEIQQGTSIVQSVTLTLHGKVTSTLAHTSSSTVSVSLNSAAAGFVPRIGLGCASDGQPLTERETSRLKRLKLSHLRVDLTPAQAGFERQLRQASNEAKALGIGLEVALLLSTRAEEELREVEQQVKTAGCPVWTWLIFSNETLVTPPALAALAKDLLSACAAGASFGAGTNAYFCELASVRPVYQGVDLLCYSIHPQEHAFDNASIVETLQIQRETVANAREIGGTMGVAVSPVTLKRRFNPYATSESPPKPGELPSQVDVRQMSLIGAAWTLGSLKHLGEAGAQSVTLFETAGWRGVMERDAGSPLLQRFPSTPGSVFPLYHVLAAIGEVSDGQILGAHSSEPLRVEALALSEGSRSRLLIANLTAEPQQVVISGLPEGATVLLLDERTAEIAQRHPDFFRTSPGKRLDGNRIDFPAFAIARVDSR